MERTGELKMTAFQSDVGLLLGTAAALCLVSIAIFRDFFKL